MIKILKESNKRLRLCSVDGWNKKRDGTFQLMLEENYFPSLIDMDEVR